MTNTDPSGPAPGAAPSSAFGQSAAYRQIGALLWTNAIAAVAAVGVQAVTGDYGDLLPTAMLWVVILAVVFGLVSTWFEDRNKVAPHATEVLCGGVSAGAVVLFTVFVSNGPPSIWAFGPVLLTMVTGGGSAVIARVHIRGLQDAESRDLRARLSAIEVHLAALLAAPPEPRRRWWPWRSR